MFGSKKKRNSKIPTNHIKTFFPLIYRCNCSPQTSARIISSDQTEAFYDLLKKLHYNEITKVPLAVS